jgi:hypothetical protein
VSSAFFLAQDINLGSELSVGLDGTWLSDDMTTPDFPLVDAAKEQTNIVARLGFVQDFAEHLDRCDHCLARFHREPNNLDFFTGSQRPALYTPSHNGSATSDAEDIFNGHEERQVRQGVEGAGYIRPLR